MPNLSAFHTHQFCFVSFSCLPSGNGNSEALFWSESPECACQAGCSIMNIYLLVYRTCSSCLLSLPLVSVGLLIAVSLTLLDHHREPVLPLPNKASWLLPWGKHTWRHEMRAVVWEGHLTKSEPSVTGGIGCPSELQCFMLAVLLYTQSQVQADSFWGLGL